MLRFKNMRQRVDFAFEQMGVDIYYEGNYTYTVADSKRRKLFEFLSEEQVDQVLNRIWDEAHVTMKVG